MHNNGRDVKRVLSLTTTALRVALLFAAALISCKKEPEKSQAPERSGDVFKADIAGKEWQADSLSVGSPKDSLLFITGLLRKDQYVMETFTLGFSGISAPGEYAMIADEKSVSGKAGAVLMRGAADRGSRAIQVGFWNHAGDAYRRLGHSRNVRRANAGGPRANPRH